MRTVLWKGNLETTTFKTNKRKNFNIIPHQHPGERPLHYIISALALMNIYIYRVVQQREETSNTCVEVVIGGKEGDQRILYYIYIYRMLEMAANTEILHTCWVLIKYLICIQFSLLQLLSGVQLFATP